MAYQNIKPGIVVPPVNYNPKDLIPALEQMRLAHNQTTQEVRECHKRVQQFLVSPTAGSTTWSVVLEIPSFTPLYFVGVDASFDNGGFWTSSKTTTGFTLHWKTATAGSQTVRILVIE